MDKCAQHFLWRKTHPWVLTSMGFNWGSAVPDRITLEDGTEVAVPCDALDGDNYGCGGKNSDGHGNRRGENSERGNLRPSLS